MAGSINPRAGQLAPESMRIDVAALVAAYHADQPDPTAAAQRAAFGTCGHRGSAFDRSLNEWHVLAITQAICNHREFHGITGSLFMGIDTHTLLQPACASALQVLAANGVEVVLAVGDEYTPTPAVSHAILTHNRGRNDRLADDIVITPSHNPLRDGGFKYNPPHGGPAGAEITAKIEDAANVFLATRLHSVQHIPHAQALQAATTHRHDHLSAYVGDLASVIDMDVIRSATLRMGVDPLGGASDHYWAAIAERYRLDLTVVSDVEEPTFAFMALDWDGEIRMNPSSKYAMQRLQSLKNRFNIAFTCDTDHDHDHDHDRPGIVTPSDGLWTPDRCLTVAINNLFQHWLQWSPQVGIGKTVVSTRLIDRLSARLGRTLSGSSPPAAGLPRGLRHRRHLQDLRQERQRNAVPAARLAKRTIPQHCGHCASI